jgi:hypothetical protein
LELAVERRPEKQALHDLRHHPGVDLANSKPLVALAGKLLNIIAGAAAEEGVASASTAALSALLYIMLIIGVNYRRSEVGA